MMIPNSKDFFTAKLSLKNQHERISHVSYNSLVIKIASAKHLTLLKTEEGFENFS